MTGDGGPSGPVDAEGSPNAARMYDYLLGGAHNFRADREQVDRLVAASPDAPVAARANRAFLRRVVLWCLDRGIDQFLDLGSGVPTVGNVHEVAASRHGRARVAYVDLEPVAVARAEHLLADRARTTITHADLRDAEAVLASPGVAGLLDLTRPVALLAVAVLHFVDGAPGDLLSGYVAALAPGSAVAVSHLSDDFPGDPTRERRARAGREVYRHSATPLRFRSRPEIRRVMGGLDLVEPGLVDISAWPHDDPATDPVGIYGVVGTVPAAPTL